MVFIKNTNEFVDQKLVEKGIPIKRIDNYIGSDSKIKWKCLNIDCGSIWSARPNGILNHNKGCPKCNDQRLTNEIVDQRLLQNYMIKRIGNYINSITKIEWECLNCMNIWLDTPTHILNDHFGCPKCKENNDSIQYNSKIDQKLINRNFNIKRIGNVINADTKICWQCLNDGCNTIWEDTPHYIFRKNRNKQCPTCVGRLVSNEVIDSRLKDRNIKRISDYLNIEDKMIWQCLNDDCANIWSASANNVLNNSSGCPICKNKNEKIIFNLLKNNNIEFEYQKDIRKIILNENRFCRVDFYLPFNNLIIEYNGAQHYHPVTFGGISSAEAEINFSKQIERDFYIKNFCIINNIRLLEIDGRNFFKNKLKKYIISIIEMDFEKC